MGLFSIFLFWGFPAAFLFSKAAFGRPACIGYFGGPYDLESLEHGFNFVMHLETLSSRPPRKEPDMGGQPPIPGAIALAFVPGKAFVDRVQRAYP